MAMKEFPPIGEALILCLRQRFSCGPPLKEEDLPSLYLRAGHAEVIAYLESIKDKQNTGSSKESTDVLFESQDTGYSSPASSSSSRRAARRSENRS